MRHALQFIAMTAAFALVMLLVRAFAFTPYRSSQTIKGSVGKDDCVMVNRLCRRGFVVGDLIAFRDSSMEGLGRVIAVPGDTVSISGQRYVIPHHCCNHCPCPDCKIYLVTLGRGQRIVHLHSVMGKAHRWYHLPW